MELEEWYKKNSKKIVKGLLKKCKSLEDAEDILQNMSLKVLEKNCFEQANMNLRQDWSAAAYYKAQKKHIHEIYNPEEDLTEEQIDYDLEILKQEFVKILDDTLNKMDDLKPKLRGRKQSNNPKIVFIKRFIEEKEYRQIAKEMNLTEKYVRDAKNNFEKLLVEELKNKLQIS